MFLSKLIVFTPIFHGIYQYLQYSSINQDKIKLATISPFWKIKKNSHNFTDYFKSCEKSVYPNLLSCHTQSLNTSMVQWTKKMKFMIPITICTIICQSWCWTKDVSPHLQNLIIRTLTSNQYWFWYQGQHTRLLYIK